MPQWALFIVDSQVGQGYKLLGASIETSRTASAASAVGESLGDEDTFYVTLVDLCMNGRSRVRGVRGCHHLTCQKLTCNN
jgi:hypothetical protein